MLCMHVIIIPAQASFKLGELLGYLDRFEPNNHQLYYDVSLAFTRLVRWGVWSMQWVR